MVQIAVSLEQHRMNTLTTEVNLLKQLVADQQIVVSSMADTMEKLVDLIADMIEENDDQA